MFKTTKERFQFDVLENTKPVVVIFYEEWSQPCLEQVALLAELETEMDIATLAVEIEEELQLAEAYHVASVPVMKIFVDGASRKTIIGYKTKEEIVDKLTEYI